VSNSSLSRVDDLAIPDHHGTGSHTRARSHSICSKRWMPTGVAANYLSVGQIYLYDNPLLKKPLELAH